MIRHTEDLELKFKMPETIVLQTYRSWWAEFWLFIAGLLFLLAGIFLPDILIPIIFLNSSSILFGIFILFIILAIIDHYRILYIITNKRVIRRVGIIAKYEKSVFCEEVTDVRLHQNFIERILGIGGIEVDTSEPGIEMDIEDVRNPEIIYNIVNNYVGGP